MEIQKSQSKAVNDFTSKTTRMYIETWKWVTAAALISLLIPIFLFTLGDLPVTVFTITAGMIFIPYLAIVGSVLSIYFYKRKKLVKDKEIEEHELLSPKMARLSAVLFTVVPIMIGFMFWMVYFITKSDGENDFTTPMIILFAYVIAWFIEMYVVNLVLIKVTKKRKRNLQDKIVIKIEDK